MQINQGFAVAEKESRGLNPALGLIERLSERISQLENILFEVEEIDFDDEY